MRWISLALLLSLTPLHARDDVEEYRTTRRLSICGPRSVQRVLEHYGQSVELTALVTEIQGGVVHKLASLRELELALQKRGLHTLAVDFGWLGFPSGKEPAILHYSEDHFVVLDEVRGGFALIRDGVVDPAKWEFLPSVMSRQSGVVLLTSTTPIDPNQVSQLWWPRVTAAIISAGLAGAIVLLGSRIRKVAIAKSRMRKIPC